MKSLGVFAVAGLVAVVAVGVVFAQDETPQPPKERAQHGAFGHRMGKLLDRDALQETLANTLGISVDELEDALAIGETPLSLAEQYDVSAEELHAAMQEAHAEALAQAVEDGTITQEQADEMQAWRAAMEAGFGPPLGFGRGRFGGFGSCNQE